ncbi:EamA-like transporter family protein [Paracoccus yeei]|uniref:EamA-like transporter family protein n=3 Tax=Paracoccaceae TaxID=31989 RepID=A0A1V0GS46_9RHOB|nr:DMT family transporter [Paracoccus yeei]ARC36677.1 EamA-like transporter family protein [Paracoccus yeei]AWX93142.1 EamA-like transporter family protein [Paracoccus mutanolyticus]AYF02575.1 EamA-like transporter family protein [Paracoccus yeei]MBY0137798.1 DMT family transporter [Paracoccus yeei]
MPMTLLAAILIALGGVCIAVQAPINAGLARRVESPIVAAAISFGVGFTILAGVALALGQGRSFGRAFSAEPQLWLGGFLGAFYVWAMVWSLPRLGTFTAICAVALGQIVAAIVLDRIGAFGLPVRDISVPRMLAALMVGGGLVLSRF